MKKKLLIMTLVLGITSMASATTITWSTNAITLNINQVQVVQITADDDQPYGKWMGASDPTTLIADITAVSDLAAAGDDATYTENYLTYNGWWYLEAKDSSEPFNIDSGDQWNISIKGLSTGSCQFVADDYAGTKDYITVTVIPEPMTIALLGLGGLFLRRRK
jgi:hypothetical protein